MSRYNLNDCASTLLLVGIVGLASITTNSSNVIRKCDISEQYYSSPKTYGNDTQLLEKYLMPKNDTPLLEMYSIPKNDTKLLEKNLVSKNKFTVEEEAEAIFGEMREATVDEQKNLQESIDEISWQSGVNFWDFI